MLQSFSKTVLATVAPVLVLAASPAMADEDGHRWRDGGWQHSERKRDRWEGRHGDRYRDDYRRGYRANGYYGEPAYRGVQTWRGDDGRYYCRRSDGTTGLIVGGVAGALLGREVAGRRGDHTAGAILGAAGGALLGRAIDRSGSNGARCR